MGRPMNEDNVRAYAQDAIIALDFVDKNCRARRDSVERALERNLEHLRIILFRLAGTNSAADVISPR